MKLYTEEHLKEAYKIGLGKGFANITIDDLKPIELPSDEYIDEVFQPMTELHQYYKDGFINGAKWLKEQILNQNNK